MAIRINRVYTRRGDQGQTGLVGGKRVAKDCSRIEAYGTIDELSSALGLARAFAAAHRSKAARRVEEILKALQNQLFDLGSELATPPEAARPGSYRLQEAEVEKLEELIDDCQADLAPLDSFVLPGGGTLSALLHHARTVCRRAERRVLKLSREEPVGDKDIKYLNRLSDLLFVLARWAGKQLGEAEHLWERPLREKAKGKS